MGPALNSSNDDYIRTSEERHYKTCAALWQKMEAAGDIYLDKYAGWYSVRDEAYYDESELTQNARRQALGAHRHAGRMGGGGKLFFPPLQLSAEADRPL